MKPEPLDEPLLRAKDVAALLSVDVSAVYRWTKRDIRPLPCYEIGGVVRFRRSSVEAWLANQQNREIRANLVDVSL